MQALDFTRLRTPGRYRIRVRGERSPRFRIAPAAQLFGPRVADAVRFFQAQRDGADVVTSVMHRRPAHLNDRALSVYRPPRYDGPDSDVIVGRALHRIGGPVDLEGGWMDAGDFVKFTHTTAYATALLFVAERELGSAAPPALDPEARFGLAWLDKAWNEGDRTMMLQVGIGSGNAKGTFNGDHDVWRLPEVDDTLGGAANRYLRHRPAFRANAPGSPVPPNLAGRVAAAFALAAQLDAATQPARARRELATAAEVYDAAGGTVWPPRCRTPSTRSRRGATTWSSRPPSCRWPPARSVTRAPPGGATPPPAGRVPARTRSTSTTRARSRMRRRSAPEPRPDRWSRTSGRSCAEPAAPLAAIPSARPSPTTTSTRRRTRSASPRPPRCTTGSPAAAGSTASAPGNATGPWAPTPGARR